MYACNSHALGLPVLKILRAGGSVLVSVGLGLGWCFVIAGGCCPCYSKQIAFPPCTKQVHLITPEQELANQVPKESCHPDKVSGVCGRTPEL